jgi:hypothetical protein
MWIRVIAAVLFLGGGVVGFAMYFANQSSISQVPRAKLHVKVGLSSLCVPRQFVDPAHFSEPAANNGLITGYPYHRVYLSAGMAAITSYTDWNIAIWDSDFPDAMRDKLSPDLDEFYESGWTIDSGFRSRRARRDCVGKIVGAGLFQVENGPRCLDYEIKYGHRADPDVIIRCDLWRCWKNSPLKYHNIWFSYVFSRADLVQWPSVHSGMYKRISEWEQDTSCLR